MRKNGRITLFANIFRIQDLIAAACAEGQRNKQRGNAEREKFKHGICTCAAYNKFGRCKQIRQFSADILILSVTRAVDAFIQLALPAKMNNIELLCKFRQRCPNSVVQCSRSETSTHNKYNRFFAVKTEELKSALTLAAEKLAANRRSCMNCGAALLAEVLQRVLKCYANRVGKSARNSVRKPRSIIRFMTNYCCFSFRGNNNRHTHKTAL